MDCQRIEEKLDDLLDGELAEAPRSELDAHLEQCPRCRHRLKQARALQAALRAQPVPQRPGFVDRALAVAVERGRRHERRTASLVPAALAAGLALVLGLAVVFTRPESITEPVRVALREDRLQIVRLVFDTPHALQDVTLSVHLPKHVELEGYPGRRKLSWQTNLREGQNLLTLPVLPRTGGSGILDARLVMGDETRHFRLRIDVAPGDDEVRRQNGADAKATA